MGKIYQCNKCGLEEYYDLVQHFEPYCFLTISCFGRLQYKREQTRELFEKARNRTLYKNTNSLLYTENGTFCTYQLREDRPNCKISFRGNTISNPLEIYEFELNGNGVRGFDIPVGADLNTPTSHRLVTNCQRSVNFVLFQPELPENRRKIANSRSTEVVSIGHGKGLTHPICVRVGRQDCDNEHSGSGFIHVMFAHQKTSLLDVENLLKVIVGKDKVGAIYRTTQPDVENYHRVIVLNRTTSTNPYQMVLQQRESYYRLITIYKPEGNLSSYSKYKNRNKYTLVYTWDKNLYN